MKTVLKKNNAKLIITSDGPIKDELEKYAEALGISYNVIFTGYITNHVLNDYYNLSDIFVMASKTETQGIVLVEAAAHDLPSVVLNADVTADFVRQNKTGIVANQKDFAKKIQNLLRNNEMRTKLKKNCLKTAKKYDVKNCVNELLQVYSELIKK
jgi:1,2-diacylglycerol 3-alpha-glucosyltransferase